MINRMKASDIYCRMVAASARSLMPPKSTPGAATTWRKLGDYFLSMTDYLKFYSRYYNITWDHQKFEVHHIDGDRSNNDILNLILLPKDLHQRLHTSGWFDLRRYEFQVLKFGMSDQNMNEFESRIEAIDECRRWAQLRAVEYRWPWGEPMGEITENTKLL